MSDPRRDYAALARAYEEIDARARAGPEALAVRAAAVSGWSVGQHLVHVCRVNGAVAHQLVAMAEDRAEDVVERGAPSLVGRLVLWLRRIPRGRGRSPRRFVPGAEPSAADVARAVTDSRIELSALQFHVDRIGEVRGRWEHPALGTFTPVQWLRFLAIHTEHHLAIVREVEAAPVS